MLASVGLTTPPLLGIGSTAQQVLDVRTAVHAALATPGDGRAVLAVASPETCQQLLGECLGPLDPSAPEDERRRSTAAVGALFAMSDGGITIVNWPQGQSEMSRGTIMCVNYQLSGKEAAQAAAAERAAAAEGEGDEAAAAAGASTSSGDGF